VNNLAQNWIEQLNNRARRYRDAGVDSYGALAQAAADFKLSVLLEGDVCRIYQAPDGILVNCWTNENDSNHAKGEASFDNNISWYMSDEENR
jgi:hypothetical protein